MDEEQVKVLNKVLEALSFYANSRIYWGNPIPLELNLDRRTLSIKHEAMNASEIMQDRGELAREALFEFEGVFPVQYQRQTEI